MHDPELPGSLREVADHQPYPLVFATVSGAHLYGFPSADSDWDLRASHVLPAREVLSMRPTRDTIDESRDDRDQGGLELDLVSHDVGKFFKLMLKKNGYVLEQLHSPIVVKTTPAHQTLREIADGVVTRFHADHYLGFAATQWKLFNKGEPRVKPLLYLYRVLLTGLHLMRTGSVEANLARLNEEEQLPWLDELIALKIAGDERQTLANVDIDFHQRQYHRLREMLERERDRTSLPEHPTKEAVDALDALLVELRLG
ncbi:MAG: nucleotidyltransferase domain-containing protein [Planctomycetota bacterium]